MKPENEVREAARRIRNALTRLGFAYTTKDGDTVKVRFKALALVGDRYGLLEVDTARLPSRVNIAKLTHPDVLHHLTAVVGKPVKRLNTTGLTYCVILKPKPRVRLPKKVGLDLDQRPPGEYQIAFGAGRDGPVWRPLAELCHIIVAGSSGWGKSAFLRLLLYQLCREPLPIELYLADLEGLTFSAFVDRTPLVLPIAEDLARAEEITARLIGEMERRSVLYQESGGYPESLDEYHAISDERLPWVVAIFDEFSALIDESGKSGAFTKDIGQLAMRSRKYGITLVLAGQDFKSDLLNSRISNQLRTRVQFKTATSHQSKVVLGQAGAEKLTTPGRALVQFADRVQEIQTFWVPKEWVIALGESELTSPLSNLERRLVHHTISELGGKFTIRELADAFPETSRATIGRISQKLERRGWLIAGSTRKDGKIVSEELSRLVG